MNYSSELMKYHIIKYFNSSVNNILFKAYFRI